MQTGNLMLAENLTSVNANLGITGNLVIAEGLSLQISSGFGTGDIAIGGTIDGVNGGNPENLSFLGGLGNITLGGAIGGIAPLGNLNIHSAANVSLPAVTLTGGLAQTTGCGTTTLGGRVAADSLNITNNNLILSTSSVAVNRGVTVTAATTLASDVEVISTLGANIAFIGAGSINGAHSLAFNAGRSGLISIGGPIGNVTALNELKITNSGGLLTGGPVVAGKMTILDGSGTVTFNGGLTVSTMTAAAGGYNIAFNGGGTVTNAVSLLFPAASRIRPVPPPSRALSTGRRRLATPR
jgi:fibronectin-binding autotransporter adhesin